MRRTTGTLLIIAVLAIVTPRAGAGPGPVIIDMPRPPATAADATAPDTTTYATRGSRRQAEPLTPGRLALERYAQFRTSPTITTFLGPFPGYWWSNVWGVPFRPWASVSTWGWGGGFSGPAWGWGWSGFGFGRVGICW